MIAALQRLDLPLQHLDPLRQFVDLPLQHLDLPLQHLPRGPRRPRLAGIRGSCRLVRRWKWPLVKMLLHHLVEHISRAMRSYGVIGLQ